MHGKDLHFTDISPRNFVVGLREQKGNIYVSVTERRPQLLLYLWYYGLRPTKDEQYWIGQ